MRSIIFDSNLEKRMVFLFLQFGFLFTFFQPEAKAQLQDGGSVPGQFAQRPDWAGNYSKRFKAHFTDIDEKTCEVRYGGISSSISSGPGDCVVPLAHHLRIFESSVKSPLWVEFRKGNATKGCFFSEQVERESERALTFRAYPTKNDCTNATCLKKVLGQTHSGMSGAEERTECNFTIHRVNNLELDLIADNPKACSYFCWGPDGEKDVIDLPELKYESTQRRGWRLSDDPLWEKSRRKVWQEEKLNSPRVDYMYEIQKYNHDYEFSDESYN